MTVLLLLVIVFVTGFMLMRYDNTRDASEKTISTKDASEDSEAIEDSDVEDTGDVEDTEETEEDDPLAELRDIEAEQVVEDTNEDFSLPLGSVISYVGQDEGEPGGAVFVPIDGTNEERLEAIHSYQADISDAGYTPAGVKFYGTFAGNRIYQLFIE